MIFLNISTSHVSEYGDLSISSDLLKRFQSRKGHKLSSKSIASPFRDTIRSDRIRVSTYIRTLERELNQSSIKSDTINLSIYWRKLILKSLRHSWFVLMTPTLQPSLLRRSHLATVQMSFDRIVFL